MIKAGQFSLVNPDIRVKLPLDNVKGRRRISAKIVDPFHTPHAAGKLIAELDQSGYRLATLAELLAFAAQRPEQVDEASIIAMGSRWYCYIMGDDSFAAIRRRKNKLQLVSCLKQWSMNQEYRWLVIKKPKPRTKPKV